MTVFLACARRRSPCTRLMSVCVEQLAGVVDDDALAAGALAGIDAEHDAAPERRREQELAQVLGEDADGVAIGGELQLRRARRSRCSGRADARRRRRRQGAAGSAKGERRVAPEDGGRRGRASGSSSTSTDDAEHALRLAAANGEEAVRRDRRALSR